ncbi:MAG: flavodoxin domain-containing protein [Bacteroidales bacterium]
MDSKQKILIIYQTRYGTTSKATDYLVSKLENAEITINNLRKEKMPDLSSFDKIIIGGSIRAGMIQPGIKKFIRKNLDLLLSVPAGLYLCCMEEDDKRIKQFNDSFPEQLREHATATGFFGGEFNFDRLNFLEKKIVSKAAGIEESVSKIDYPAIDKFAEQIMN